MSLCGWLLLLPMKVAYLSLLLIVTYLSPCYGVSGSYDLVKDAGKLAKAKDIFENIKNSNFVETAESVGKWGLPLLQSLGSFAQVIVGLFPQESKELKFMKEQFKQINNRMDLVDEEFENVKKSLDWNVIKIQFSKYESSINLLQDIVVNIPEAPVGVRIVLIDKLIMTYEQIYNSAAEKLYESMINADKIYSNNLVLAVRQYTADTRWQVEEFFMGSTQLLLKGLQVETFYNCAKNYTSTIKLWNNQWKDKLDNLMSIMKKTSLDIERNWYNQLKIDTESFSVANYKKDNKAYLQDFYKFLATKFSWRVWSMVIYNPLAGGDRHYVAVQDGLIQFRLRNHNVVLGSVHRLETATFRKDQAEQGVAAVPTRFTYNTREMALTVLKNVLAQQSSRANNRYSVAAVIEWGGGVWFYGERMVYRKWEGMFLLPGGRGHVIRRTYNLIVMG